MNKQDITNQALALRDYLSRGGSADRWFKSKDFSRADRKAIALQLARIRIKDGGKMIHLADKGACAHRSIRFNILTCDDGAWCAVKGGFVWQGECNRQCKGWKEEK